MVCVNAHTNHDVKFVEYLIKYVYFYFFLSESTFCVCVNARSLNARVFFWNYDFGMCVKIDLQWSVDSNKHTYAAIHMHTYVLCVCHYVLYVCPYVYPCIYIHTNHVCTMRNTLATHSHMPHSDIPCVYLDSQAGLFRHTHTHTHTHKRLYLSPSIRTFECVLL